MRRELLHTIDFAPSPEPQAGIACSVQEGGVCTLSTCSENYCWGTGGEPGAEAISEIFDFPPDSESMIDKIAPHIGRAAGSLCNPPN